MANKQDIIYERSADNLAIHRLFGRMPELNQKYGLWIINGSTCSSAPGGFRRCPLRKFEFYSISHFYEGSGRFWSPDQGERELEVGEVVLVAPGDINRYGSDANLPYAEDAIRFVGPVADLLRQSGIIRTGVYQFGPLRRILDVIELVADPAAASQIKANILLQQLLTELYYTKRSRLRDQVLDALIISVKNKPEKWWTVAELAEQCNLSENQFRRNFERYTGMPPKKYLEELKLRRAAELLTASRAPVADIAEKCGYVDPFHFSRRFKQFWGVAPERFRHDAILNR